ncbi:MAG TPA: DUF1569 domain-containing protein [Gillisia sp.]|nr:DUF1569 domain-containing protein [Gillisia sp.]
MAANFKVLNRHLDEMEEYIPFIKTRDLNVSRVDIGWHLDHSLKVINGVFSTLKESDPERYRPKFSFSRIVVFTLGRFPRGKAKAPKEVMPGTEVDQKDLIARLEEARENFRSFDSLHKNNYFKHPYFHHLNKKGAKRLMEVHTRHHLKIIRDILR